MWRLIFRSFIYALLYLCDECWINSSGSKQWSFNQIFIFWKWTKSQRSKAGKQTRGEYKLCWCGQKTPVFSKHFVLARDCTLAGTSSEAPVQSISSEFSPSDGMGHYSKTLGWRSPSGKWILGAKQNSKCFQSRSSPDELPLFFRWRPLGCIWRASFDDTPHKVWVRLKQSWCLLFVLVLITMI